MDILSRFLDRYRHLEPPDISLRRAVCEAIREEFDATVDVKDVRIQYGIAYVSLPSSLKQMLYVRQGPIVERVASILGKRGIVRSIR